MKNRIRILVSYLLFWYLLFVVGRAIFLLAYVQRASQLSFSEIISTFVYGFKLDIGIASYISFLPALFLTITSLFQNRFIYLFFKTYTIIALFICSIILSADIFMYQHWGFRIDATPLLYMTNLKAMTASVSTWTVIAGIISIMAVTTLLYFVFSKIFTHLFFSLKITKKAFFVLLPLTLMLILIMRGGIGIASLTTSTAYFSKNQFANHAAINPVWNVSFSLIESSDLQRKYVYFNEHELEPLLNPLLSDSADTLMLLNTKRPNIILFITESLTAKALEGTGGAKDILPQLNKLVKEGVLFTQVFAASDRTDKGIAAVLAGYPSLPGSSPLKFQKLTEKLAFLPKRLNSAGYKSEFYYGGTLEFANYRSFLIQAGFDKMVSDKDFQKSELLSKWGAFDHVVFNRCLAETPDSDSGFFKTILTLTSHEPFITPVAPVFKGNDVETKYLNSLHYTDAAIGDFIATAKTRKWWKNTLIIIISDHGSRMPGNSEPWEKSKYHIPMIWLGGALQLKDTIIDNLGSQTDMPVTLLDQLGINSNGFNFSKNILTKKTDKGYSIFTYNEGFGFQKPDRIFVYNTITNTYDNSLPLQDSISQKQGKAYLQKMYLDFYNKNK